MVVDVKPVDLFTITSPIKGDPLCFSLIEEIVNLRIVFIDVIRGRRKIFAVYQPSQRSTATLKSRSR